MKFRRCRSIDTLETVYEHLKYEGDPKEDYAMTSAYDHRKAELTVDKLFDRVPADVWRLVNWSNSKILSDLTDNGNRIRKSFACAIFVEQAEGALVETIIYPHVHRLDPINIPVRSL